MDIVEHDGFDALTLQRVADALGLVTTALYRYFPSKDALSAALQRRAIERIQVRFKSEIAAASLACATMTPRARAASMLVDAARFYMQLPKTEPRAWFFVALLLGDPRPLLSDEEAARTSPLLGAFLKSVEDIFEVAAREGALDPGEARERVLAFWAALHGAQCVVKARRLIPGLPPTEDIGLGAARALLVSWGANEALAEAASHTSKGRI